MKRDEVLDRLKKARSEFDRRVAAVPADVFDLPCPGSHHTPKQIVAHVTAYESLMLERLRSARLSEMTAFDRDRVGWREFNARIWEESAHTPSDIVLQFSALTFLQLLEEISGLADAELVELRGVSAGVDPAWLAGRSLWELIGIDGFDHYPMHFGQLEAAALRSTA
jgi:hypothetical protein